jgi:hypothetical protein
MKNAFLCIFVPVLLPETLLVGSHLLHTHFMHGKHKRTCSMDGRPAARRQPAESTQNRQAMLQLAMSRPQFLYKTRTKQAVSFHVNRLTA